MGTQSRLPLADGPALDASQRLEEDQRVSYPCSHRLAKADVLAVLGDLGGVGVAQEDPDLGPVTSLADQEPDEPGVLGEEESTVDK